MISILNNKDRLGSLLLLAWSLFYLRYSFEIPTTDAFFTARTLPLGLATAAIICCLLRLLLPSVQTTTEDQSVTAALSNLQWRPVLLLTLLMLVYALSFNVLGFMIASCLFLLTGFIILGEQRWRVAVLLSIGITLGLWLLLTQVFELYLDPGDGYRLLFGDGDT